MRLFRRKLLAILALVVLPTVVLAAQNPIHIVAAENFYGDIAAQIGGPRVQVTSILSNPDQDPHLFEASVSTAQALSHAQLVVYNGAGYDAWMEKLLAASPSPGRQAIVAGRLLHKKEGDNPHLWYDPVTMPTVAKAIASALEKLDPTGKPVYRQHLTQVLASLRTIQDKVSSMRSRCAGLPVTATEPVFGYMAHALGFVMRNAGYQLAVMNDVEPSASQIKAFEKDLKTRKVKILFYNSQVTDASTERAERIAQAHRVPVVGVTETMPAGSHFQAWMMSQLSEIEKVLAKGRHR